MRRFCMTPIVLILAAMLLMGLQCGQQALPETGAALFTSPQTNPMALSADGNTLYVANTTSGTVSVVDVASPANPIQRAEIGVGLDPVGIAVRPKASPGDAELVLVANHISDTISVIDAATRAVVQTIQEIDPQTGVTRTNEPVGIVFEGPSRAYVTLDEPNQVIVLDFDAAGRATIRPERLTLTAQAPRALAVADGRLYVAAFESGNQTEMPICAGDEDPNNENTPVPRGLDETNPYDEGCEFYMRLIDSPVPLQNGLIVEFAARSPNIGGRVIRDRDVPDRDVFVYDTASLALVDVVEGVGSLLYGVATGSAGRVYVTNTEARNQLDGLLALGNRMFENRVTLLDCGPAGCSAPAPVDLESATVNSLGVTVPTPYGVAVSGDGETVVVSVSGSDGLPASTPGTPPGQTTIPGLAVLDRDGNVLGTLPTGAIPQGLVLASDPSGAASVAYVLNTVDNSVSVVDVSTPGAPSLLATTEVGSDPTPELVRKGRIAFSSARASTSGTFSCESCHPAGNTDQLIWTINTAGGPGDPPAPNGDFAEPRATMPIRGLRDTLPLHWDGTLGDPFGGPNGIQGPGVDVAPNCADEASCFRQLADAAISGVMCRKHGPGCPIGAATNSVGALLDGALDDADRDAMAAFMGAVSYPPSPRRRPMDDLSAMAAQGVQDFFTDEDGQGIGSGAAQGVGASINFAPITCADNSGGCHTLPLTAGTNSVTVGAFEAPSIRGLWDRSLMFSNGFFNSEEVLTLGQDCADGTPPFNGVLPLDPCNIIIPGLGDLRPNYPSGEQVWDPAVGPTERGTWMASFEMIFDLAYGTAGAPQWEYVNEMSVGLPGLTGRQLSMDPANADAPDTLAALAQIEQAANEGRITAVAHSWGTGETRFDVDLGVWMNRRGLKWTTGQLREHAKQASVVTVTAHLPGNVSIGGADRQPLLDVEPLARATEEIGDLLAIPRFAAGSPSVSVLGVSYVDSAASVYVDGELCAAADGCSAVLTPGGGFGGADVVALSLKPLDAGIHVVQFQNPAGWFSNEMPVFAEATP